MNTWWLRRCLYTVLHRFTERCGNTWAVKQSSCRQDQWDFTRGCRAVLLTDTTLHCIQVHYLWIMYRYIYIYIWYTELTKKSAHKVHLVDGLELSGMLHILPQQLEFALLSLQMFAEFRSINLWQLSSFTVLILSCVSTSTLSSSIGTVCNIESNKKTE